MLGRFGVSKRCISDITMAHPFKLTLVLLTLMAKGSTAVQQRSHNHGPGWPDHCWDTASNHLMDPFCAILTDVACGAIPELDHATHTVPENTKAGAVVTYTCDRSYSLDGNDTIVCVEGEKDGSKTAAWTETPTCVAGCSEAPLIDNGYSLPHNETSIGGIVQYVCDNLFVFSSNYNFVICQNDTLWSTPPTCERVECSEPPTIEHGYALNENDTYLGATVNYTCIKDYAFVSSSDVTCQMSGKWSDAPTCRRAQCGKIPIVLHGFSSQSNNTFVGTTVNYTCDINYRLIGMETVTCQENEVWSAVPICECQSEPMDIVFIADTSGSIGGIGFQHTLDFITKMTESYPKSTTHFGMITFSSNATVEFYLDTYVNNYTGLLQAIKDAYFSAGGTDTYEAFQLARSEVFNVSNGMRENVTQIAVVVTDGQSNNSSLTIIEAQKLKGDGVTIYSVGVGDFDTVELKAIASNESYVFSVQTFGDLSSVTGPLSSLICLGDSS